MKHTREECLHHHVERIVNLRFVLQQQQRFDDIFRQVRVEMTDVNHVILDQKSLQFRQLPIRPQRMLV
jgi:hypothetical protein